MRRIQTMLVLAVVGLFWRGAVALTLENEVTADYVRQHPKEFSIKAEKREDGLIHFTIQHDPGRRMYHVAHATIRHAGQLIAETSTPVFGQKQGNTFYIAVGPGDLPEAEFDISDSDIGGTAENPVPVVGSIIHKIRLLEFVPRESR